MHLQALCQVLSWGLCSTPSWEWPPSSKWRCMVTPGCSVLHVMVARTWVSANIHSGVRRLGRLKLAVPWRSVLRGAAEDVGLHAGAC